MQQAFEYLITQLRNPASAETQAAMRILDTSIQNDIPTVINIRIKYQPPFFNSMGLFADFENTERAFAATVPGLNPDLWVNFVTEVRRFIQQPQQPQQPQQQQQQQQQQPQVNQPYMQQQQQQPQQRRPQQDAEPVLGPVPPMPQGIGLSDALATERRIYRGLSNMPVSESIEPNRRNGGKRSRSNKRGHKKSIRRKKSSHKKRK